MFFRAVVSATILVALSFFLVPVALAHGGEPRLEISMERLSPGGVVDVRGVEFDYEELVTLALIGSEKDIVVGEITTNVEGEFTHIAVLPSDLAEGTYYFRATTSHHWAISPPLTVWGIAYIEGGGQGPRDEDDGLLAPMPMFAPGVVPEGVSQPAAQLVHQETYVSNRKFAVFVVLGLFVTIGVLGALGLRVLRKR
jgi:hypothetical protein